MTLAADVRHVLSHTGDLWRDLGTAHIFLTGGTGFFGCWLLESFTYAVDSLSLSARVTVLTRDPEAFQRRAPHLAAHPAVTLQQGDVRTFAFSPLRVSHIIHAATEASVAMNREQPDLMYSTIVEGTQRVLAFAAQQEQVQCLYVSSGAVYGEQPVTVDRMTEDEEAVLQPLVPYSAYAEGKRASERMWCSQGAGSIARCYAFVGPYMSLNRQFAVGNFIRDALHGGPIHVHSDGTPRRSYLYAADLAIWLWRLLCKGERGRAYNVGSDRSVSVEEVARIVATCAQPPVPVIVERQPTPGAPVPRYVPSVQRAASELGLRQYIDLPEAVQKTMIWYAQQESFPSRA